MIYIIGIFLIILVGVAYHFYLLGWTSAVKELEDERALCDEWYKIKERYEKEKEKSG